MRADAAAQRRGLRLGDDAELEMEAECGAEAERELGIELNEN